MRALLSGQAALALVIEPLEVRAFEEPVRRAWHGHDALRVFDGCDDVIAVDVGSCEDVDRLLETEWASDRAFRLALLLLEPSEPSEQILEYAACLDEILKSYDVAEQTLRRFSSHPVYSFVDIARARDAIQEYSAAADFVEKLIGLQSSLTQVFSAFSAISNLLFGGEAAKERERIALVRDGSFLELATALVRDVSPSFVRLQITARHRSASAGIAEWFKLLNSNDSEKQLSSRDLEPNVEDKEEWESNEQAAPDFSTFLQVRAQQRSIVGKVRIRDLAGARWLTNELVTKQQVFSTSLQLGKSLSLLAREALRLEVPELALEWSEWATRISPTDPMTFGHFANALINVGRLAEAEEVLDQVAVFGDPCFASNGRARVLRAKGRLVEARAQFLATYDNFKNYAGAEHALLGAAEILRELGQSDQAIVEYRAITEGWPGESSGWAGLAMAMSDVGHFDDAIRAFGRASLRDDKPAVLTGRAWISRIAGRFNEAESLYKEVLTENPNDTTALCGRGENFRADGNHAAALNAFDLAMERAPYSAAPVLGKLRVLRDTFHYDEALGLAIAGCKRFPFERRFPLHLASVYRKKGDYKGALASYREVFRRFPFEITARVGEADVLGRIGQREAALVLYDNILKAHPHAAAAVIGKSALLVKCGRVFEAENLIGDPGRRTRSDWKRVVLRAFIAESTLGISGAIKILLKGMRECPFSRERFIMRSRLVSLQVSQNKLAEARALVASSPIEISGVVAFHFFTADNQLTRASELLESIRRSQHPDNVIEFVEELAKRHGLTKGRPDYNNAWILTAERNIILEEAV